MSSFENQLNEVLRKYETASILVQMLGNFQVWREGYLLTSKDWGRDKAIQLFQFLVTTRHRKALHKEQIMDQLWEDDDDQYFKVALHGINKALEPERKSHSEARFISRQGLAYQLNTNEIWIDANAFEELVALGNQAFSEHQAIAKKAYIEAIKLYKGPFLPERLYEDWSCDERERLQVLALGTMITLAELTLPDNPLESIRLSQQALLIDAAWEDAYRIQMEAYFLKGNRPMAIKTYQQCEKMLDEEMGVEPLPETKRLYKKIITT
ncbi:MAG: BTAD domain-containing putative transcriptional regulator [Spirosomataceae bacterium]